MSSAFGYDFKKKTLIFSVFSPTFGSAGLTYFGLHAKYSAAFQVHLTE